MKTLVKKTEKKEMKNFDIVKTKELFKIKGGESTPVDNEIF